MRSVRRAPLDGVWGDDHAESRVHPDLLSDHDGQEAQDDSRHDVHGERARTGVVDVAHYVGGTWLDKHVLIHATATKTCFGVGEDV